MCHPKGKIYRPIKTALMSMLKQIQCGRIGYFRAFSLFFIIYLLIQQIRPVTKKLKTSICGLYKRSLFIFVCIKKCISYIVFFLCVISVFNIFFYHLIWLLIVQGRWSNNLLFLHFILHNLCYVFCVHKVLFRFW